MKNLTTLLLIFISHSFFGQINGTVKDENGKPIPFVTIFEENTALNTITNANGNYVINIHKRGNYSLVYKLLGYKTQKINLYIEQFPFVQNCILSEENYSLKEVMISGKKNKANEIIKNAIASKKENTEKTNHFTADFYSKGLFKVKNLPKKFLGQKIELDEVMESSLDSSRSGILYLSETFSKIAFEKPNHFKEKIIASKIAGDNKGYSYNSALSSNFNFYEDLIPIGTKLISPLATNAFQYYKFHLENSFFDENHQLINKIKVIAKRDKEPVFEGFIYIVDGSWAIYAVDLEVKGYRMNNEFNKYINIKQQLNFDKKQQIWIKTNQSLSFLSAVFGIEFSGQFNYVYSNYDFNTAFNKKSFGNEILSFESNSNNKNNEFWETSRPIPLTTEEIIDYKKKDSISKRTASKPYLDSIDAKNNKFKFNKILTGYTYKNSFKKSLFNFNGLVDFSSISFNTVQGFNLGTKFNFYKWNDENGKNTNYYTKINYGFSDKKIRLETEFSHQFNNQNYSKITISTGSILSQFNDKNPIEPFVNDISSIFFKNNFMKLYSKEFLAIQYKIDIANGVTMNSKISYLNRKPVANMSNYSLIKSDKNYTSNNPIAPDDYINPGFESHHLTEFDLNFNINFANKYISRLDGKINLKNELYPTLTFQYKKAFAASENKYEYDKIDASILYKIPLKNKGKLGVFMDGGHFFGGNNIAFIDYTHFNGNQTHISFTNSYLQSFLIMPYYANSSNSSYFQFHSEYNDNGFIMNKIPLLSGLKSKLVLGFHQLSRENLKPYSEFNIGLDNLGFGKFKLFRLDYVRSFQGGVKNDGLMIGLKFSTE